VLFSRHRTCDVFATAGRRHREDGSPRVVCDPMRPSAGQTDGKPLANANLCSSIKLAGRRTGQIVTAGKTMGSRAARSARLLRIRRSPDHLIQIVRAKAPGGKIRPADRSLVKHTRN
jgi:hypothetical protein